MKQILAISLIIPLMLLMCGCDGSVKKAAEYMDDLADALGEVQTITIDAQDKGLISQDTQNAVLKVTLKANLSGKEIVNILTELDKQGVSKFDSANKAEVFKYLTAISDAIDPLKISEIAGITDSDIKNKIQVAFEAARTAISAFNVMLQTEG